MPFKIVRNDITRMKTDAIVNTANSLVAVGPGCDSAIYEAAGYDKLLSYRREHIGEVPEGEVFITPGFNLDAKYIIHAVSPCYKNGLEGEEEKLRACYQKSLKSAYDNKLTSIAFPLISTGSFGYPKEEGMRIAADEINSFLINNDMTVYLVVFDDASTKLGSRIYSDLEEYIDRNFVSNQIIEEYSPVEESQIRDRRGLFGRLRSRGTAFSLNATVPEGCEPREESLKECKAIQPPLGKSNLQKSSIRACAEPLKAQPNSLEDSMDFECLEEPLMCAETSGEPLDFDDFHADKLEERMKHLTDTFSEYLLYLISDRNMENSDVYKRAVVDKKTFSKIKNNPDYHPQKLTALCLCVGAKLNLDESKDLLARAGYALSPCDKTDIIFSYFIENEIYDMIELDIQLEEHGLPCIIE